MVRLKENIELWKKSLQHPEPYIDEYYIWSNNEIINDENLYEKRKQLNELIRCYSPELPENQKKQIIEKIHKIIMETKNIQYTEFISFCKTKISFSIFKKLPLTSRLCILTELLDDFCSYRLPFYQEIFSSNAVVQILYDMSVSRKKGVNGIIKLKNMFYEIFGLENDVLHLKTLDDIDNKSLGYFFPDKGNKNLFKSFCHKFEISYIFGKLHQGKLPDCVLKTGNHFFIIETKHIMESGGAQDKQITELINFIKYSEKTLYKIHYVSFLDGLYFNNFITVFSKENSKIAKQKNDIEKYLKENPDNFFVNTVGFQELLKNLANKDKMHSI